MFEYAFYHLVLSFITCGIFYALSKKRREVAFLGTAAIGLLAVIFFFPDPKSTKTLSDLFGNAVLIGLKAVFVICWIAGALLFDAAAKKVSDNA